MNFFLHIFTVSAMSLFPILGCNMVFGRGKILYFGQEALSLASAYTFWVLVVRYEWHPLFALFAAAIAILALVVLFSELSLRLEADGLGVLTIAMHLMAMAIVLNWQSVTRGALGIPKIPRLFLPSSPEGLALFVGVAVFVWALILWRIDRGKIGRALAALGEHPWHASALGINRRSLHFLAFLLAGIGSLLSGIFFPAYFFLLTPSNYDFPVIIYFIMCIIAGGPGRVWRVLTATFVLTFVREGIRFISLPHDLVGPVRLILFGLILLGAVWWRRDSLFPAQRTI